MFVCFKTYERAMELLSIPLNGFLRDMLGRIASVLDLSIPLNGFPREGGGLRGAPEAFNSIEWIRRHIKHNNAALPEAFNSIEWIP